MENNGAEKAAFSITPREKGKKEGRWQGAWEKGTGTGHLAGRVKRISELWRVEQGERPEDGGERRRMLQEQESAV